MNDFDTRLNTCFFAVFPDLLETQLSSASQSSVSQWDSIAAVTLLNVIEEEFSVQFDLERLSEFDNYTAIRDHLLSQLNVL